MYENLLKLGNRRVLVIDDEEFTLSALESILRILKVVKIHKVMLSKIKKKVKVLMKII